MFTVLDFSFVVFNLLTCETFRNGFVLTLLFQIVLEYFMGSFCDTSVSVIVGHESQFLSKPTSEGMLLLLVFSCLSNFILILGHTHRWKLFVRPSAEGVYFTDRKFVSKVFMLPPRLRLEKRL